MKWYIIEHYKNNAPTNHKKKLFGVKYYPKYKRYQTSFNSYASAQREVIRLYAMVRNHSHFNWYISTTPINN